MFWIPSHIHFYLDAVKYILGHQLNYWVIAYLIFHVRSYETMLSQFWCYHKNFITQIQHIQSITQQHHFTHNSLPELAGGKGPHRKHCGCCWPHCQKWLTCQEIPLQTRLQPGSCLLHCEMDPLQRLHPCLARIPAPDHIHLQQWKHRVVGPQTLWLGILLQQGHWVFLCLEKEILKFMFLFFIGWQDSFTICFSIPGILCAFQDCTNLFIPIWLTWHVRFDTQNFTRLSCMSMASWSARCTKASFKG